MAEHGYLYSAGDPKDPDSGKLLLAAKRNIPLAWLLAFERSDVRDRGRLIVRRRDDAVALLRLRIGKASGPLGPKVTAIGRGFVDHLAAQWETWLVIDARELESGWQGIDDYLENRFALVDAWPLLDDEGIDDDDIGIGPDVGDDDDHDDEEDAPLDVVEPYRFIGGSVGGDLPWLRPPTEAQARLVDETRGAFERAGFVLAEGPRAFEDYDELVFTHARHAGVRFVVHVDEENAGTSFEAHRGRRRMKLGHDLAERDELDAWAMLAAEHLGLLTFPNAGDDDRRWSTCVGAPVFGERMPTLPAHVERLRTSLDQGLRVVVARFQYDRDIIGRPRHRVFDLGPQRALSLEHIDDPAWEPHVRASIVHHVPAEAWWQGAQPDLLVPPSVQWTVALEWLERLPGRKIGPLEFSADGLSVQPERFNANGAPAQMLDRSEVQGTFAFVGANLVIVTADGTRSAFRFAVPPTFDRRAPPFVSGFRTAPSGERFASVLRVGSHIWRFDNEGRLIG